MNSRKTEQPIVSRSPRRNLMQRELRAGYWSKAARVLIGGVASSVMLLSSGSSARIEAARSAKITVFASGLNDPRGLAFGPDKHLYVAEAGSGGGTLSTVGLCEQIQPPLGP